MNPPPLNIPSSSSVRTVPEENSDTRESVGLTPVSSKVFTDISKELISQGLTPGTTDYIKAYKKRHYQKNADKKKAYQQEYRERKKKAQVDSSVQIGREYTVKSRVTGISEQLMSQGLIPGTTEYRKEYLKLYHQTTDGKAALKAAQQTYRQTPRGKAAQKAARQTYNERKKKAQVDSSVQMGRPWDTPSATFRRGAPLQHETSGNEGVNQRMRGAELTSEDEARATKRKSQPEELSSGIDGSTIKVEPQEWMGVDDMWVQSLPLKLPGPEIDNNAPTLRRPNTPLKSAHDLTEASIDSLKVSKYSADLKSQITCLSPKEQATTKKEILTQCKAYLTKEMKGEHGEVIDFWTEVSTPLYG
uniref:hypothetical protein n=3 Tax=Photobacterium leiognathi TaxID=553611 RepID=UPI002982A4A2